MDEIAKGKKSLGKIKQTKIRMKGLGKGHKY